MSYQIGLIEGFLLAADAPQPVLVALAHLRRQVSPPEVVAKPVQLDLVPQHDILGRSASVIAYSGGHNRPGGIQNCFARMGIKTVGELVQLTRRDLLKEPWFGHKSLKAVEAALAQHNLKLREF